MRKIIKLVVGFIVIGLASHGYAAEPQNGSAVAKLPAIPNGKRWILSSMGRMEAR